METKQSTHSRKDELSKGFYEYRGYTIEDMKPYARASMGDSLALRDNQC